MKKKSAASFYSLAVLIGALTTVLLTAVSWNAGNARSLALAASRNANLLHLSPRPPLVLNDHKIPARRHVPIVLYVYDRPAYFKKILRALSEVTDIETTTLVISFDGHSPRMLDVALAEATFCRTVLIHRPVPLHYACNTDGILPTFDDIFFGGWCPVKRVKDHWWWLQEQVWGMDSALVHPDAADWRLFMEEDHLPSQDYYVTAVAMCTALESGTLPIASDQFWAFGMSPMQFNSGPLKVEPANMFDGHYGVMNMGYGFSRKIFERLNTSVVRSAFFAFEDGWDYSLFHLMQKRLIPRVQLLPRLSRVKHIGRHGITQSPDRIDAVQVEYFPLSGHNSFNGPLIVGERLLYKDPALLPLKFQFGIPVLWWAHMPGTPANDWRGEHAGAPLYAFLLRGAAILTTWAGILLSWARIIIPFRLIVCACIACALLKYIRLRETEHTLRKETLCISPDAKKV